MPISTFEKFNGWVGGLFNYSVSPGPFFQKFDTLDQTWSLTIFLCVEQQ